MDIKINDKFKPLFGNDSRYYLLTGGRGSAKSFSVALHLCALTFEPNQKILFTRYTLTSAKVSIIPEFIEKIELLNVGHHFKITNDSIENTSTGSTIIFKGVKTSSGNQTAALKSLQGITTWVYDEAEEEESEENFDKIDLSIRTKGVDNKVVLILNPSTKEHWIYKKFFESQGVNEGHNGLVGNTTYIHTTYLDNLDNLDPSFLNNIEIIKATRPEKYQHMILGGWLNKAEGVIFDNWSIGEFNDNLPYVHGLDFGVNDPDAMVKVAVDNKNLKVYVQEMLFKNGQGTKELIHSISNLVTKNDLIAADYGDKRAILDLQDAGYNAVNCYKDKITDRIKNIKSYDIIVTPNSTNIIKELNNYAWSDKRSETPIDKFNHTIDAMFYGFNELYRESELIFV